MHPHRLVVERAHGWRWKRQLKAIHDGLVVLGTASPVETVDLMFQRIKSIENALKVEGAATVDEGFEKLFVRVRNIEAAVKDIQTRLG